MKQRDIFAERFLSLRGEQTQERFAELIGISRPTVGFYEAGDRVPDIKNLRKIAECCNVSADWLLGITDNRSIQKDIRIAQETLGISATSAENISKVAREKRYPSTTLNTQHLGAALDLLLSSGALREISKSLYHLLDASEEMWKIEQWTVEELREQDLDYAEQHIEDAFSDYRLARLDLTESIQALMNGNTERFISAQDASKIYERSYARCEEAKTLNEREHKKAAEAHEAENLRQLKEVEELGFCTVEND